MAPALGEGGGRASQSSVVDEDVELLVVERDHPRDRSDFTQRVIVGPDKIGIYRVADPDGPVLRRDSLVGAYVFDAGFSQGREYDVGGVNGVTGRQTCLEK